MSRLVNASVRVQIVCASSCAPRISRAVALEARNFEVGLSGVAMGAIVNGNKRIERDPLLSVLQDVQVLLLWDSVVPILHLAAYRMIAREVQASCDDVVLVSDGVVIEHQA
jgi:hypothetical protein